MNTFTRNQGMTIANNTYAHHGKITMTKIQAVAIVNDTFAYKTRFGKLPCRMIWKGIDDNHRREAFRIVDSIVKRVKSEEELEVFEDRTPMTKKEMNAMCSVKPWMPRRKVTHCGTRRFIMQ